MRLRYWIKCGLKTFGAVIAACGIYALLVGIQMDDMMDGLFSLMPLYLLLFGGMMLMSMNIGVYKLNLPLALSFGSTRNEAIVGLNLFRIIPAALMTAILTVLCAVSGGEMGFSASQAIPIGLGVYLATGAIGTLLGIIFTKYGKVATVITVVLLLLCGGGMGLLAGYADSNSFLANILFSGKIHWLVLGIGLLLYSLAAIPEQRTVWKCNVKI